ncbi:MAG: type III secretion system chaperone [Planctomycetota bacterium]|jgi:hypothetical protein|nr:type III secretion system chaperone [Planctomycetota bacterium]
MDAKKQILALTASLGLDQPVFNQGTAAFQFDDLVLNFHADDEGGRLTLFMDLGELPEDPAARLTVYALLLKANAFGRRTGGGVLGIDDDESRINFSLALSGEFLEESQLERAVEAFLNVAEMLAGELAAASASRPPRESLPAGVVRG